MAKKSDKSLKQYFSYSNQTLQKKCGHTPTHAGEDQVGNLYFYSLKSVIRVFNKTAGVVL